MQYWANANFLHYERSDHFEILVHTVQIFDLTILLDYTMKNAIDRKFQPLQSFADGLQSTGSNLYNFERKFDQLVSTSAVKIDGE